MFLSNINILDFTHSISLVGLFVQQPFLLGFAAFAVLFTAVLSRYETHQRAERLVREHRIRHNQQAREMRQQNELMHQMMQKKTDKI